MCFLEDQMALYLLYSMAFEMLDVHWLAMRGSKMEFNVQPSKCSSYHVDCLVVVLATHNVPSCEINGIKDFSFVGL
jgi:hypothetical protein